LPLLATTAVSELVYQFAKKGHCGDFDDEECREIRSQEVTSFLDITAN